VIGKTRRIESVCRRYDVPLPAAALQFPLAHTAVAAIIPGPNSPGQVRANIEHMRRTIPEQLWEELRREGLIHPEAPTPR
jgi:D-threo-aldose 1-dehydrogenase